MKKLSLNLLQPFKNVYEKLILSQFYGYDKLIPGI